MSLQEIKVGYFYFASIRCTTKHHANRLQSRYHGQTFVFTDGDVCRFSSYVSEEDEDWWVTIMPSGVTDCAIIDQKEARRANEFTNVMYGMLRNETYFDYAITGVECEQFRSLKELKEDLADLTRDQNYLFNGLVVSKEIVKDSPITLDQFQYFNESHVWLPKKPEKSSR